MLLNLLRISTSITYVCKVPFSAYIKVDISLFSWWKQNSLKVIRYRISTWRNCSIINESFEHRFLNVCVWDLLQEIFVTMSEKYLEKISCILEVRKKCLHDILRFALQVFLWTAKLRGKATPHVVFEILRIKCIFDLQQKMIRPQKFLFCFQLEVGGKSKFFPSCISYYENLTEILIHRTNYWMDESGSLWLDGNYLFRVCNVFNYFWVQHFWSVERWES